MKTFTKKSFKINYIGLLVLLGFLPFSISAQSTLNASGASQTLSSGTYDYSVGEMMLISTQSNANITVTQGLLQIEDPSLGVSQTVFSNQNLKIYPNPVDNILNIKPDMQGTGELSVQLFDIHGRRILQKKFSLQTGLEKQQLDLSSLEQATYMLNVQFNRGKQSYRQSYKIIKSSKP
ncbi:T9SS type A sorting domain-containing protein [Mesonia sp. MT50]|uniref:T9SS type A sorting domain-containing protein n=1 Tax=Mesonia profundi TaxID=3070998 RepID=A0ABU0ZYP8_9FLAO|nr:T9SS type A sorting domain-containing protein [Mesonia profundi]MDQ7916590.1 T9SS type A sorting domain-containing protein [Mesonia profundi]